MIKRRTLLNIAAGSLAVSLLATGCGGGSKSGTQNGAGTGHSTAATKANLKVVYLETAPGHTLSDMFGAAKAKFEKDHPGSTVKLQPINASETDFYTKVALMQRSPSTAPDLIYEDSFQVNADAEAGYLIPLDDRLASWPDWTQYGEAVRAEGKAVDGKVYGIPLGTDTQGIWYNKRVFAKAGLPTNWQPKTWNEVLDAARAVKKLQNVVPINVYATKAQGEAATLRGVENLISGTPGSLDATLYDSKSGKWVTGSKGMLDTLTLLHTLYQEQLLPSVSDMENPNLWNVANDVKFPAGKMAMMIDGNWISGGWAPKAKGGTNPWPTWTKDAGWAAIPTQDGAAPGITTMSGGWTVAIGAKSSNADAAWDLVKEVNNKANNKAYILSSGNIPVRKDVVKDPDFIKSNPSASFFAKLVDVTHYRPALSVYPQVSNLIMQAAEDVTVGGKNPGDAAASYDKQLAKVVGQDKVEQGHA